jgi:hypothetical protein
MRSQILMGISLCMIIVSLLGVLYLVSIANNGVDSLGENGLALILLVALLIISIFGFALSYLDPKSKGSNKEWKAMTALFPRVGVLHNEHYVEQLREAEEQRFQENLKQNELAKEKKG